METINNYLETMFLQLPDTVEVQNAKDELHTMMEDKYNALMEEGMTESEAQAQVISEFGNLSEIAGALGIDEIVRDRQPKEKIRALTKEEVDSYMEDVLESGKKRASGVFLLIASLVPMIILNDISNAVKQPEALSDIIGTIGIIGMFACLACGVGLIILASSKMERWKFLRFERCSIDYELLGEINEKYTEFKDERTKKLVLGIALCILSFTPAIILDVFEDAFGVSTDLGGAMLFLMVAIGVYIIMISGCENRSYLMLMGINERGTVGANYFDSQKDVPHYEDKNVEAVMSVYWHTVTCLYLIWSFLTFHWWITWIIWPVAAIIHKLLVSLYGTPEKEAR